MSPKLYPYQEVGARFLTCRTRALLSDDMGTGKTFQAIAACDALRARHVVVVCPASVRENWRREFVKFSVSGIEPMVFSYDTVARGKLNKALEDYRHFVLILDEAHYLKNRDANRTKAIFGPDCDGHLGIITRATHVFLLTGTPTPNHPAELWPMLRACAPETIVGASGKPDSYWQYVKRYCKTRDNGFGIQIVGGKNLEQLRERLQLFMLRRTKEEVLPDLPEIRFDELFVEGDLTLNQEAKDQTWAVQKALQEEGIDGLKRIAPHVATLRRLTGLAKVAPVVEWVRDWLEAGGSKIVLFAHHREVIEGLHSGLATSCTVSVVTGSTPPRARQFFIDEFQNNQSQGVFIGQIQAAGIGINLTAASDVLFVESSWVPAENQQAAMRIHRIGQKNACLVRFATLAGSIDEQIQKAVARKTADISALFGASGVESV